MLKPFIIHKQRIERVRGELVWDVSGEFGEATIVKHGAEVSVSFNDGTFEAARTYVTAISRCYARHCAAGAS